MGAVSTCDSTHNLMAITIRPWYRGFRKHSLIVCFACRETVHEPRPRILRAERRAPND
jgi:hypothetical protein